eukprot:7267540-Karenia_brevis.AAC.1
MLPSLPPSVSDDGLSLPSDNEPAAALDDVGSDDMAISLISLPRNDSEAVSHKQASNVDTPLVLTSSD